MQADMHRLQPIHRKVSASLAYRLDCARAMVGTPNAAESEPPAKSFSTLRLLIFLPSCSSTVIFLIPPSLSLRFRWSLVDGRRLGHIFFLGRLQKTHQSFSGGILVMMAAVASVGLLVQATRLEGLLGVHESESMTMCVPSLANGRHPRHVTADAAAKGVNPVDRAVLNRGVTAFA